MHYKLKIRLLGIALIGLTLASCAPANFEASSGTQRVAPGQNPDNDPRPIVPEVDTQSPNLPADDLKVLNDCGAKAGQNLTSGGKLEIESTDIMVGIGNKTQWQDTLAESIKPRVLIVNIRGQIANKIDLELGNPNTTYCLNIKLQIVNSFNMRVSKTAKIIDVYQNQITNHATRSQI